MDEGILTGIITAIVLGCVAIYVVVKGRNHNAKKKIR